MKTLLIPRLSFFPALLALLILISACGPSSRLTIRTTPGEARIRVNESEYPAPFDKQLDHGVYSIRVLSSGYEPWRTDLEFNRTQTIHAILTPTPPPPPPPPVRPARIVSRLSVFVEQRDAAVIVDGVQRGSPAPSEPIVVQYEQQPTLVKIQVVKRGYETWERSVTIEEGKDNRVFVRLTALPAWHTYVTDGEFLRRTVAQVVGATSNLPTLNRTGRISVLSITHAEGTDEPLQTTIEDAMIATLAQAGFTPAERDDQLLIQLAHSTSGDVLPYRVLTRHDSEDAPFIYDAALATTRIDAVTTENPTVTRAHTSTRGGDPCCPTANETTRVVEETNRSTTHSVVYQITGHIPTADQFLAYRILECGLGKTVIEEGEARPEPMFHRVADVRVHLRIIDAKTGRITWAGFLTGRLADEIPARVSAELANPPSHFMAEPLPDAWQRLRHRPRRKVNADPAPLAEPRVR
jgi:hypothetical protein